MIDALEFKRHKAAAVVFVSLNVLGAILWVAGIMITTVYLVKSEDAGLRTIAGNIGAVFLLLGYGAAGLFSIAFAQVVRYLASIAEATGKHAQAYLDAVSLKNTP